jgi:hypothetical protein
MLVPLQLLLSALHLWRVSLPLLRAAQLPWPVTLASRAALLLLLLVLGLWGQSFHHHSLSQSLPVNHGWDGFGLGLCG